jgi:hypothetical protein
VQLLDCLRRGLGLSLEELVQLNNRVVEHIKMLQAMQAHVDMMAFYLIARVSASMSETDANSARWPKYNQQTITILVDGDTGPT